MHAAATADAVELAADAVEVQLDAEGDRVVVGGAGGVGIITAEEVVAARIAVANSSPRAC